MNTSPIQAIVDEELRRRSRADMELVVARRIAADSDNIDALRHVVATARLHSEHETDFRNIARKAAERLIDLDKDNPHGSFVESRDIIEAAFPQDKKLLQVIDDIYASWRK